MAGAGLPADNGWPRLAAPVGGQWLALVGPADPAPHQSADFIHGAGGEAVAVATQTFEVLCQAKLKPQDFRRQVDLGQNGRAIARVLRRQQPLKYAIERAFDALSQNEAMISWKRRSVLARPQNQVVGLRDHDQFLMFLRHRTTNPTKSPQNSRDGCRRCFRDRRQLWFER